MQPLSPNPKRPSAQNSSNKKKHNRRSSRKPIVYLSSAIINLHERNEVSSSLDYFVSIISTLSTELHVSQLKTDLVLKLPKSNETGKEQAELLRDILANKPSYKAIIIAPLQISFIEEVVKEYIKNLDNYYECPIFLIDKYFKDSSKNIPKSINAIFYPYATSNWFKGGSLVANFIYKNYLKQNAKTNILILKGLEGSQERIDGFVDYIRRHNLSNRLGYTIVEDINYLNFTREGAMTYCKPFFAKTKKTFDVVFACNDEMAIGAREAILELKDSEKFKSLNNIKIIGFDGVKEFRRLAQTNNSNLVATVDVKINSQINHLISGLTLCLKQGKSFDPQNAVYMIDPVIWTPHG